MVPIESVAHVGVMNRRQVELARTLRAALDLVPDVDLRRPRIGVAESQVSDQRWASLVAAHGLAAVDKEFAPRDSEELRVHAAAFMTGPSAVALRGRNVLSLLGSSASVTETLPPDAHRLSSNDFLAEVTNRFKWGKLLRPQPIEMVNADVGSTCFAACVGVLYATRGLDAASAFSREAIVLARSRPR